MYYYARGVEAAASIGLQISDSHLNNPLRLRLRLRLLPRERVRTQ